MFLLENTIAVCLLSVCQPASLPRNLEFRKTSSDYHLLTDFCLETKDLRFPLLMKGSKTQGYRHGQIYQLETKH